ncbi:TonB family protein [Escherichia coli]|nr:TonB family protein [Escherichia coli]EJN4388417.1 TonB family protein [Escherichia coli]EKQ6929510.1 TonB family protein [Escherichia coli]EKQ6940328.1 TonB family protein [Escherichia coli]EKQ6982001.1 TonB family protein [Escherichia coli]
MKRNLPLIILLSSLVMGCTQHKADMPRQLVKALPQYPAYAAANYIKGRVDVKFDIGADGTVTRIEFIRSEPHHLFDEQVVKAMAKWRFEKDMPRKGVKKKFIFSPSAP